MKKYVTKISGSNHYIYRIGFGTYDILKSGLDSEKIKELLTDFISMGGNVIDTSRYDIGFRGSEVEQAQKLVGEWILSSGMRDISCLIGKSNYLLLEDNKEKSLSNDLEHTLRNLNTDYIDVFLVNGDDETTEISSIIEKLEHYKTQGKILSYGCSNWKPYRIRQAMEFSMENNFDGFKVNQMFWNIGSTYMNPYSDYGVYIKMDEEMIKIHKEFDILAMPYGSLANGFFAKLYTNETDPGTIDIESLKQKSPYYTNENLKLYEKMKEIGEKYLASPGWVALGYLFNQEIDTCPILSCRNLGQLREAFEAIDRNYTYEDFKELILNNEMVIA